MWRKAKEGRKSQIHSFSPRALDLFCVQIDLAHVVHNDGHLEPPFLAQPVVEPQDALQESGLAGAEKAREEGDLHGRFAFFFLSQILLSGAARVAVAELVLVLVVVLVVVLVLGAQVEKGGRREIPWTRGRWQQHCELRLLRRLASWPDRSVEWPMDASTVAHYGLIITSKQPKRRLQRAGRQVAELERATFVCEPWGGRGGGGWVRTHRQ